MKCFIWKHGLIPAWREHYKVCVNIILSIGVISVKSELYELNSWDALTEHLLMLIKSVWWYVEMRQRVADMTFPEGRFAGLVQVRLCRKGPYDKQVRLNASASEEQADVWESSLTSSAHITNSSISSHSQSTSRSISKCPYFWINASRILIIT